MTTKGQQQQLSNDAYGNTVSYSTDGTYDYYLVGGSITYTFPTGTPQNVVYLSIAIQTNLPLFMQTIQIFIQSSFPVQSQLQFVCMYLAAQAAGLTNRQAYIGQLLTWLNSIESYAAVYVKTVQGMTDPNQVAATSFDSTQIPSVPTVTLLGAIQIIN